MEIVAFLLGLIGGIAACAAGVLLSRRREKAPVGGKVMLHSITRETGQ